MTRRRFAVLDRDGTIIVERHYLSDPEDVELLPGAVEGLRHLRAMGLGLVVLTNQSAIGRGYFDEARLGLIHQRLRERLAAAGVQLDGIYFCPHLPDDHCECRKPRTGLMERAAGELGFDPAAAFVIGDKPCDVEMGRSVGATTFLVRTGYGAQVEAEGAVTADYVVEGISEAAQVIQDLLTTDNEIADHNSTSPGVSGQLSCGLING